MSFLDLLDDIQKSLDSKCYIVATLASLTLPDICGAVEFPEKDNGTRYKKWYSKYIGEFIMNSREGIEDVPWLSADVVYSLRCNFLHGGIPKLSISNIKQEENKVTKFKIGFNESSILSRSSSDGSKNIKEYQVNAVYLSKIILNCSRKFYLDNKEKIDIEYSNYNARFETMVDYE